MATSQASRNRRGGRGMHKRGGATGQNSEEKGQVVVFSSETDVTAPKPRPQTLPEFLEQSEIDAMIRGTQDAKARLLMLIQWRAGLRVSEALALTNADLNLDGPMPTLNVRLGKGAKQRLVPVHPELIGALRGATMYSRRTTALLFPKRTDEGSPMSRQQAWTWVKEAYDRATEAGAIAPGRKIATHTLRHSFARHMLMHGKPINAVSLWLGHSSIQTTMIYLKLMPGYISDISEVP